MERRHKEDWFQIGMDMLIERGPGGLLIELLTKRLGVTKGSFYHHFASLEIFKAELRQYIEVQGFSEVIGHVDVQRSPREQLDQLLTEISERDPALERAVRRWASQDPDSARLVARLDEQRLSFLEELFSRLCPEPQQAQRVAQLYYAVYLGALSLNLSGTVLKELTAQLDGWAGWT